MKLICELCSTALEEKAFGAVCPNCGIEYSEEWLRERRGSSVSDDPYPVDEPQKPQRSMKLMWIIFAVLAVICFVAGLLENGGIALICMAVAVVTLFIFKPWEVYGGKP